ncbi:MAG: isocitrate lyase/PEP mutase family protein [Desulfitobacterium sp.]|nr:isocitrate lyase/PEP mutase family protein [Desulfitobacterium sp.]
MITNAKKLRNAIAENKYLVVPGGYDALSVALAESIGFKAAYVGGYSLAASITRTPDFGMITQTEMLDASINIINSVDIPIVCDIDQGFGALTNLVRTIHAYENAGVAAVHIEDQPFPKKCAMMPNRTIVSIEDNVKRLKAAIEIRNNPDFMIIARTDSQQVEGIDGVLRRLDAYLNAGADYGLYCEFQSEEDLERVAKEFPGKVVLFFAENRAPIAHMPFSYYGEMGYPILINCTGAIGAAHKAIRDLYQTMMDTGQFSVEYHTEHCTTLGENNALSRIEHWNGLRDKYGML